MNTDAVMCMALTSARPSRTPLSFNAASTCGVMLRNARRPGVSNQSSLRYDFTVFLRRPSLALGAEFGCRESADCRRSTTTCANNGSCPTDAKPRADDVTVERDQSIPLYGDRDSQTNFC